MSSELELLRYRDLRGLSRTHNDNPPSPLLQLSHIQIYCPRQSTLLSSRPLLLHTIPPCQTYALNRGYRSVQIRRRMGARPTLSDCIQARIIRGENLE